MVKVIMGLKGSGKTKKLIDLVRKAADEEHGNVVCIDKDSKLRFDIPYTVRLVEAEAYGFGNYDFLKGFISGLHAGNYDITHVFIDGLLKLVDDSSNMMLESFLDWCESFSNKEKVKFTVVISADAELASAGIKKYF